MIEEIEPLTTDEGEHEAEETGEDDLSSNYEFYEMHLVTVVNEIDSETMSFIMFKGKGRKVQAW